MKAVFQAIQGTLGRLREHFPLTSQGVFTLAATLLMLRVLGYGAFFVPDIDDGRLIQIAQRDGRTIALNGEV